MLIPFSFALHTATTLVRQRSMRILVLLFGCALGIGTYFGGGQGVSINALFSLLLAMCLLLGLTFDKLLVLEGTKDVGARSLRCSSPSSSP